MNYNECSRISINWKEFLKLCEKLIYLKRRILIIIGIKVLKNWLWRESKISDIILLQHKIFPDVDKKEICWRVMRDKKI